MQSSDAERLIRAYGDKPCSHPHLKDEYYLGSKTGDVVCTTCGRSFYNEDAAHKDALKYKK